MRRWKLAWRESVHLVGIEPDQMTMLTDIDIYLRVIGEHNIEHRFSAGRAEAAAFSFAANCMKPQWVDRFWRKCAAKQFDCDRASAAIFAGPKDAMGCAHFFQRRIAPRAEELTGIADIHLKRDSEIQAPISRENPNRQMHST